MKFIKKLTSLALISALSLSLFSVSFANDKIVIAHRGASGYLPEHSMACKSMAYAMGVDYIEQDVVMTKDDQLVVLHDHFLDRVTNVALVFPDRKREDARYYAIDFTLDEIKSLEMTEGFEVKEGKEVANYKKRFPIWKSDFKVHTLEEEIEMIQGLNKSMNKNVGIYVEIKAPWFHRHENKDISKKTLEVLKKYGYTTKDKKAYLQCFDPNELIRINDELLKEYDMDVKLVQLMAQTSWNETMVYENDEAKPYDYDWMFEEDGMDKVAKYADGVGPWKPMIIKDDSTKDNLIMTNLVKDAHKNKLEVHPYTFRNDEGKIPAYCDDFDGLLDAFYNKADVDGVFTDYPDLAVKFLNQNK